MREEEEGDSLDEFYSTCNRQTQDEAFEADGNGLPRYNRTGPGSPVTDTPTPKLGDMRWDDHLNPNEARDVWRAAKAGDRVAKQRLVECYQKALLGIAGKRKYSGPPFDERLSAAWVGFWKALARSNLSRNNAFWSYARKFIVGAVVDCVHDWHRKGGKGETRDERKERSLHRPIYVEYDTIETGEDAGGNPTLVVTDDHEFSHWNEGLSQRLANIGRNLGVPRECIGVDENPWRNGGQSPKKSRFPIPRFEGADDGRRLTQKEYLKEHPTPAKHKISAPTRGNAPALGIIGWLAKWASKHAELSLRVWGRKAYALVLVRRDLKRRRATLSASELSPHLFEDRKMSEYVISVNTARTASDSSDWKSDADRLAATAEVRPLVFDEKYRGRWYLARQDRRPRNEIETTNTADAEERQDHEVRKSYPRHKAGGVRSANGSSGGDTRGGAPGQVADERPYAASAGV